MRVGGHVHADNYVRMFCVRTIALTTNCAMIPVSHEYAHTNTL